jgi:hypothetical protein
MWDLAWFGSLFLIFGIGFGTLVVRDNRRHPTLRSPADHGRRQEDRDGKAQAEEPRP